MRRPVVAGNWKMHCMRGEAAELARGVLRGLDGFDAAEVILCPPFTALAEVAGTIRGSAVRLGGQNLHWEPRGAFTGEISAAMLTDLGCSHVIVGHSERRARFGETDETVRRKTAAALEAGLQPIVCVGETLEQRERGSTEAVLVEQIDGALRGLGERLQGIVVAYEPVWAIGTGRNATADQAQAAHALLRERLASLGGRSAAAGTRILYGGSVQADNAAELFAGEDVDGGLIGGASLAADSFVAIVRAAA